MAINPDTLKKLRSDRGLSQQALAERCGQRTGARVSKRTIARIESNDPPKTVRMHTVQSLAKALDVTVPTLAKPVNEIDDTDWKERGYTPIKILLRNDVRFNYRLVTYHYEVTATDLIDAAPWMFTVLAEMSLADRTQRLKSAGEALDAVLDGMTEHFQRLAIDDSRFADAYGDEAASIKSKDIFGEKVFVNEHGNATFDSTKTNPFVEFLRNTAQSLGCPQIDPDELTLPYERMPSWPVFQAWLHELTGGDTWAKFAVRNAKVGLSEMPDDIKAPDKVAERIEWLVSKIPPEMREREEKRRAELAAMFGELEA